MLKNKQVLRATALLFLFGAAGGQQFHWGGTPATVTLHIVDTYGAPVKYRVESFHDVDKPEVELARQFEGLTFRGAFTGKTYEFRAIPIPQSKEFPAFKERITVGETSTFALFAVPENLHVPDMIPYPVTRLTIKPMPADNRPTWAVVRATFLPQVYDLGGETVAVDRQGSFTLHGLHGGRYTVTVCQDDKILGLAFVDIPLLGPSQPIEVRLR